MFQVVTFNLLFFRYETYKEGLQINFSTGYIDPEDMISESYPPINQQTRELYEENQDGSYQDKVESILSRQVSNTFDF